MRWLLLLLLGGCASRLLPEPDAAPPDLGGGISCSQFLACTRKCIAFDECVSDCNSLVRPASEPAAYVMFRCMDEDCTGVTVPDCSDPGLPLCDQCLKGRCPTGYKTCQAD